MTTFITPAEVLLNWVSDDKPSVSDPVFIQFVDNANAFTNLKFPTLAERIPLEEPYYNTLVKMVLSRVVIRAWNGADSIDIGVSGYSFTTGPFAQSGSYDTSKSEQRGTIFFTQADIDILKTSTPNGHDSITFNDTPWSTNNPQYEIGDYERFSPFGFGGFGWL